LAIPALFDEKEFPYLNRDAPWLPLVRTILGDDCKFIHAGCMLSLPGSESQVSIIARMIHHFQILFIIT
jgi:hypothetical protein